MDFSSRRFKYDALLMYKNLKMPVGELFQVSEISLIRGGEIDEHIQYCDEITYAVSGKAMIYSGEKCEEIREGQVHYIKSSLKHKIVASDDANFNYICIGFFPGKDIPEINSFFNVREETDTFIKDDDGSLKNLTSLFLNEFYMQDEQSHIMINSFFLQILISLARIYKGNFNYIDKKSSSTSNYAVYKALRYIDKEFMHITSVKDIAKALSYSEYYLSHIFSEKIGMSIKEYIVKKKLYSAAEMLKTSDLSIDRLSEYLNFNSAHTFHQAFKKSYSLSPGEYRKKYRKF